MSSLRSAYIVAAALVLAGIVASRPLPAVAQSAGCAVNPTDLGTDAEEQAALDAINALRAEARVPLLSFGAALGQAAVWKSANMAATGVFSHDDSGRSFGQRFAECGYRTDAQISENLAWGTETGRATVQMWRESAGHHRNMLNPAMRSAGIARVRGSRGWYWTATFGSVPDAGAPADPPQPAAPPSAATSGGAQSLQAGGLATVAAGRGDCLNVRAAPSRGAGALACLPDGTVVRIAAGPTSAEGMTWWRLEGMGWAAGEFLVPGGGRPAATSLTAFIQLPRADEDRCLPPTGSAGCDAIRLALWLGDADTWAAWLGQPALDRSTVPLLALRFRAEQGSGRSTVLLRAIGT